MSKDELIEYAIERFKVIAEQAHQLSTGNVAHGSKIIEGHAKRCYEFFEKHKDDELCKKEE